MFDEPFDDINFSFAFTASRFDLLRFSVLFWLWQEFPGAGVASPSSIFDEIFTKEFDGVMVSVFNGGCCWGIGNIITDGTLFTTSLRTLREGFATFP
jgi:hypothetical protein